MRPVNDLLRLSQRVLQRAGRDLIRTAEKLPVKDIPSEIDRPYLERNRILKDRHKGQRCFVIGNGPSLKTQDLSPLAGEVTFVMNAFWQHPIVDTWQPNYYCISDSFYFDGSPAMKDFFRSLTERIDDSTFLVQLGARQVIEDQRLLPLEKIYWIAFAGEFQTFPDDRKLELSGLIPSAESVSQLCIMLAIYMGCSPIYLLGLDHDWLSHVGNNRHFYEGQAGIEKHPDLKPLLSDWSYKLNMQSALKLWSGYEKLQEIGQRENCRILNATNGGFLDVFERVQYEKVVGEQIRG